MECPMSEKWKLAITLQREIYVYSQAAQLIIIIINSSEPFLVLLYIILNFNNYKKKIDLLLTMSLGKKRRLTLLECNNDINSMIDVAKIADLVSPHWQIILNLSIDLGS